MLDKEEIYDKWSKLGLLEGLDNLKILDNAQKNWANRTTTLTQEELEEWVKNQPIQTSSYDPSMPLLPMAIRVSAQTLAGGGWQQSKKQKQKQDRLNKLRKLQGDEPNVVLPDDEFVDGLVSVQPLSVPSPSLFYLDFKYNFSPEIIKITPKKRNKKNNAIKRIKYKSKLSSHKNKNINRADKFKYILKNNNKKWMISRFLKKKL